MELCQEADKETKANNGHEFMITLKTRCQNCGRSPKQKGRCPAWLNTYMHLLFRKLEKL
jgi:hypothetical protein